MKARNVEIVSIGEELLLGEIADTNAAWIARELAKVGAEVKRVTVCGDTQSTIAECVAAAARRADLVICTGGLGPTEDDRTRFALAELAGVELLLNGAVLEHIREIFRQFGRPMPETNAVQAMFPEDAVVITNPRGTAAGMLMRVGEALVAAFPGVPHEMKAMIEDDLIPIVAAQIKDPHVRRSRRLHVFGIGESTVNERIRDLMEMGPNPVVGLAVSSGVITVRVTAWGKAPWVEGTLERMETQLAGRLGDVVFGCEGETLQNVVARSAVELGKTLALAESCTAGLIASRLGEIPGVSAALLEGIVAYSNDAKVRRLGVPAELIAEHGAVSAEVAASMAEGVRRTSGADLALSVTGIAGPEGGSEEKPVGLVYFGLADAEGTRVGRQTLRGDRNQIRDRAAKWGLNLLRMALDGINP